LIDEVARNLGPDSLILLDGEGLSNASVTAANQIAATIGCKVLMATFPSRVDGGPGRPACGRLPYFPEHVMATLEGVKQLILCGAEVPVSFFAYPNTPSVLVPESCQVMRLAHRNEDIQGALSSLVEAVDATKAQSVVNKTGLPDRPEGELSTSKVAAIIARLLPENAIICGDSGGGGAAFQPTQGAVPHTWLNLTGGSIGQGGPAAVGAAVACPDRKVLALLGDGASMYTNQALWTQARESLDVTTVIFSNQKYGILETEYLRLGVNEVGEKAASLFDLGNPTIDFVSLAASMGVPGTRATTVSEFEQALKMNLAADGPGLIEVLV